MVYTIPNLTSTGGMEEILAEEISQVNPLAAGLLFLTYLVIFAAGFFSQDRKGAGNLPMWGAIAGLITTLGAFILYLYDKLVNIEIVTICLVVSLIFAVWFLVSQRD